MCAIAKSYFTNLFKKFGSEVEAILAHVQTKISNGDNVGMVAPFDKEEFILTLFQIHGYGSRYRCIKIALVHDIAEGMSDFL